MFVTYSMVLGFIMATMMFLIMKVVSDRGESGVNSEISFECGFNPITNNRMPFSIQFFLIALIFLVFDVEIVLLFPFPLCDISGSQSELFIFLGILTAGLFYEWEMGALWWSS